MYCPLNFHSVDKPRKKVNTKYFESLKLSSKTADKTNEFSDRMSQENVDQLKRDKIEKATAKCSRRKEEALSPFLL